MAPSHAQAGRTGADPEPKRARIATIDVWRGLVLCCIFVNHVPGNVYEHLTPRNFGFSDSAEAFVFISGIALGLAYGGKFVAGRRSLACAALGRRAVRLYLTHLALSLAGLAIFALGAMVFDDAGLMEVHGRDLAVEDPWSALIGLVSLGHQFGYFNILPLYILLVAAVPLLLWLAGIGRALMLGCSFTLYLAVKLWGLNVPSWPMKGTWFLDPFAWQFLLAIGLAVGLHLRERAVPVRSPWLVIAAAVVGTALVVGTDAFGAAPGLDDAARAWLDLDKTTLGLGRLVHFLCLAYLLAGLHVLRPMQGHALYAHLGRIGRHGLPSFVVVSLLAAVGQVLGAGLGHTLLLDTVVVAGGLALLDGAALLLDRPARLGAPASAMLHGRR